MTREELEHAIRAACAVVEDDEVYVFGSQAILGHYPDAPEGLRQSADADITPVHAIENIGKLDGNLGELSPFHQTYKYYVHGVGMETAILPNGWQRRAIRIQNANTGGKTGWCPEAHDLAVSKLVAFRPKDLDFVRLLMAEELVSPRKLMLRVGQVDDVRVTAERVETIRGWIKGIVKDLGRG